MTKKPLTNVASSERQRLLNLATAQGEDFQRILVRYANERLLYRLSESDHAGDFVLKGAMLFHLASKQMPHRTTRDVDLLGCRRTRSSGRGRNRRRRLAPRVVDSQA